MLNISIERIIEKLNGYFDKNDYPSAERHLNYWLSEARAENNSRVELSILNEQIGLYRKLNKINEGIKTVEDAVSLVFNLSLENEISGATVYLNGATAYKTFGDLEKSLALFEKAKVIYELNLKKDDSRLAGLYNNMALTYVDMEKFDTAKALYENALSVLNKCNESDLEKAITYLNLASCIEAENGIEECERQIFNCLDIAQNLLENWKNKDGYFAFVCEKCASVFGYYGYFLFEEKLKSEARKIYEGA